MSQVHASPEAGVCSPRISHASGILSQDVDTSLASLPSLQSEATNATAASVASAAHDYWACHTAPLPAVQYQAAAQYSPQSTADAVQAEPYAEAGQLEAAAHGRLQQLAMNMYRAAQLSLPSCGTSAIADLSGGHSCSHPYGVSTLVDFANAPAYIPAEYQSDPFSMSLQHAAALGLLQDTSSGLNTYKYHNNGQLLSQLHQASCSSEAVSSSVWTSNQHAVPEPYTSLNHAPNLSISHVNQAPQPASELYGWQVAQAHVAELMMQNAQRAELITAGLHPVPELMRHYQAAANAVSSAQYTLQEGEGGASSMKAAAAAQIAWQNIGVHHTAHTPCPARPAAGQLLLEPSFALQACKFGLQCKLMPPMCTRGVLTN